jgi:DNA helicase-2/ATP-dependent DNA helicase PcrA
MEHVMDFDDMIRFPVLWERVIVDFDMLLGDEAQDNNRMRTMMAKLVYDKGAPCHFILDDRQSIMGFTGADTESMEYIIQTFNGVVMPLTVNFRCGKNIILEAQRYVKDIQAYEGNCEGEVHRIQEDNFISRFLPGDCALSRTNAAMVPFCFKLLKEGKHATIQGADFGLKIMKIVDGFSKKDINDLYDKLEVWYDRQLTRLDPQSTALDSATDMYEVIRFFADQSKTLEQLKDRVKGIFNDNVTPYKFSTAHKAKGLEWDRVFILNNDNFKMTYNKKPWQIKQEENLHYVAITRAKQFLAFVASKDKKGPVLAESSEEPKAPNKFQPMHQTEMPITQPQEHVRDELDDFLDF